MKATYNNRKNEGYEIQFYNRDGNYERVVGCDTLEDVAKVLISFCNGNLKGNYPTIWYNGKLMHG